MDLEKIGEKFGFVLMFFISATILFFILKILKKMPDSWTYFHVLILVFLVILVGIFIKKWLK
jgi:cell division protein FtsW (lipid II flippase)